MLDGPFTGPLQDALDTYWEMFHRSSVDNINLFTEVMLNYTYFPIRETRSHTYITSYNTKLTTGDMEDYNAASCNLRR